ncbi:MAG: insulinase family protein [Gemmatimonadetes bacterium]|nr:insulinase family protein [Gemmatimonadota bacterium]
MRTLRNFRRAASLVAALPLGLAAQFPAKAPAATPIKPASFPPFQQATLPNGMRLLVVQSHKQPVVSVSLSFQAGSVYEPAGKAGLADMVASLLTKGAGNRSADEIAAAIEGVGGSIGASAGEDFLGIRADVLASDAKLAFDLVADATIRPTFPEKEVELLRTQTLSSLALDLSQPASLASRAFARGLYGAHPYARRADPASVKSITRDDIVAYHKARVCPSGSLLVVAGDLSLAQARALAMAAFGAWTGTAPAPVTFPAFPVRTAREIVLVHRPGSVQSNIVVGNLTWAPGDPRAYGATIVNRLLGGGADARLFMVLREQKSWTYGAYSSLVRHRQMGDFEATAEVRTEVTDSALVEMLAQLGRVGSEPLPAEEFERTKNALTGAFPLSIESANQVASQVSSARLLGLPADYVPTYRQKLAAVTAAQAQVAAKAMVRPAEALIVVVGDATKLREKLEKIAPVTMVSADGTVLKPEDLVVKAGALDLAMERFVPHTDSFAILVQGNPFGGQSVTLEKVDGGWKFTDATRLAAIIQQSTEVRFTDRLVMQSVHQTGKVQGQDAKIDVTYTDGHAKGSATTPAPGGAKTIAVDTDVPAGVIDDNALQAFFPALKWAAGAKFALPVFQSGKGSVTTVSIAVSGEESVKVVAGTFDAWKADVTGGAAPLTIWIEKGGAHRLLKLALVGTPVEFQLAK